MPGAVVVLAAWEAAARTGVISALYFPPPSVVWRTFVRLVTEKDLLGQAGLTLLRLARGLVVGGIPGVLAGWAMGWSRRARALGDPLVAAAHPIPKIALLPLIMVIFGIGELSKTIVVGIGVFFPLAINTMTGVRQISPIHFDVARNLGASRRKVFRRVVVPGSLPVLMAGIRLAVNIGLLITIAVELVSANRGIGARLWLAWETFRPEEIYAGLVVLVAVGIVVNLVVQTLTRRLVPWRNEPEQ